MAVALAALFSLAPLHARENPVELEDRVEASIYAEPALRDNIVNAHMQNGKIVLSGTVDNKKEQQLAEKLAKKEAGGVPIRNDISITKIPSETMDIAKDSRRRPS